MTEGNFVDYVKINIKSGNGGKGSSHFRREKYITKGGPDGGNGGRGGHVIILADKSLWTLYHFKFQKHFKSGNGGDGSKSRSSGADGEDIIIRVPVGTILRNSESNELIHETLNDGEKKVILKGGMGGLGNWNFKSPTNQAPRYSQPGKKGEDMQITLELKVLADVGLVGFPNSGKSTLLKTITSANPKIGNYKKPSGGYFISYNTNKPIAKRVIALCEEAGVLITPAGSTYPHFNDPADSNIRLAPTFLNLEDLKEAMEVFTIALQIAYQE